MKNTMFENLVYQYGIIDWEEKKNKILKFINKSNFERQQSFDTDRNTSNNSYLSAFSEIFKEEIDNFRIELKVPSLKITNVWSVKYQQGDFHPPHTHSSTGYSGIIYLDYDEYVHTSTYFINSITDPITDLTMYSVPSVHEGALVIAPSNVLHFTYPNTSNTIRSVIGFDIKFS
jgi:hypothetical protein